MDLLQATTIIGYLAIALSFLISVIAWYWVIRLGHKPFSYVALGIFLIGIGRLLDIFTINRPSETLSTTILFSLRIDIIIIILGMAMVVYGFLNSHKNTKLFAERLILYNFIFGIAAASYYFFPDFTVVWIQGAGWQYSTETIGILVIDQFTFLPILELLIQTIRRIRAPFRSRNSRNTIWIFLIGLLILIGGNLMSYFMNLIFYIALAQGFFFMAYALLKDPLMLTISHVKIYDLVVSVQGISVGRFNFEKSESIRNEQLFSGAFSGMNTLTGEILSTNKELKMLQTEDKAVLIHKSKLSKIYLITDKVDNICQVAVGRLGRFVDEYYVKRNLPLNVNIDPESFEREVLKIFTFA
jgi:hypothetical protein